MQIETELHIPVTQGTKVRIWILSIWITSRPNHRTFSWSFFRPATFYNVDKEPTIQILLACKEWRFFRSGTIFEIKTKRRHFNQISAEWGPNSKFVVEANIVRLSLKPRRSWVINLMNQTRITRTRVEYQVEYRVEYRVISRVFTRDRNMTWPDWMVSQ